MYRPAARARVPLLVLLSSLVVVLVGGLLPAGVATAADDAASCRPLEDWSACRWVNATLRRMTLADKVGQLFVTYAYGATVDTTDPTDVAANRAAYGVDTPGQLIDRYRLGGVIYFAWSDNVNDPHQIAGLSNGIQRAAARQPVPVPMLISTDQEQGIVTRVGPPATQFPGNMALGADGSVGDATEAAWITGTEIRAIGINQDYAPVSDVNVNPANPVIGVRSFSGDPRLTARLAAAQVLSYQASRVASTAKHFPGHGDTATDSHTGLPVITHTREQWEQIDKPPFAAAIASGVGAIMTAHIVVPALDPSGDPATLSAPILTGILRQQLHFDGVVITDALTMAGVRQKYGDARVPVLAIKAGADQLLMPPDLDLAYHSVLDAVNSGEISQARIDRSVRRILRLKYREGLASNPMVDESRVDSMVGTGPHLARAQQITDRTVTLVKNANNVLPLPAGRRTLVTGWGVTTTATLATDLTNHGRPADAVATGFSPTQADIDAAVAAAGTHDAVVVLTNRGNTSPGQEHLVAALQATGKPVIAVAVREPYDVNAFPSVNGYLATYGWTAVSMEALAKVVAGTLSPTGKLPVSIPTADGAGTLYPFGSGLSYGR